MPAIHTPLLAALDGLIHPIWTDRRAAVASLDEEI
jgi:hypothetical protein